MTEPLAGGGDSGAERVGAAVLRTSGPWTTAVHALLQHLAAKGFAGAPRPLRLREDGIDEVTYLDGMTVGDRRPWPSWVHSDGALTDVGAWLRRYHDAVVDFIPPADAQWREPRDVSGPEVIIAHNDAAPYNAVWNSAGLVGFFDWDMAGPRSMIDDLAWTAFSWVPLHARHVVAAEGFTDFGRRRQRLAQFLTSYGSDITPDDLIDVVAHLLTEQIALMHERAATGDHTYRRMLCAGRDLDLSCALGELPITAW